MSKTNTASNSANAMAKHLGLVLSDTYVLAVKTHGYHWNVVGETFAQLHEMFGQQYESLFDAADEIAERMRALGAFPEGGMAAFLKQTVVKEAPAKPKDAKAMIRDLLTSYEAIRDRIVAAADFADDVDDIASEDLMVGRLRAQDKAAWMLRALLTE